MTRAFQDMHILFYYLFSSVFPLRFKTERNPSVGTMEIYSDSSWKKLCTSTWNNVEVDLTCMVMGYSNSDDYGRWYKNSGNVSETSTNFNCTTTLTKCEESFSNKSQYFEGINQLCILDSVALSVSVFSFVHLILGTLRDLIIIQAVDLAKTSFLAVIIDYVLVFSRRLLFKKIWHTWKIRLFSMISLDCIWRRKRRPKIIPD